MDKIPNLHKLCEQFDIFMFDLDRTIWDSYDKNGKRICAKQLIPPFEKGYRIGEQIIQDDCFSMLSLQVGIFSVLKYLKSRNKKIGFISTGAIKDVKRNKQPSIVVLEMYGLSEYFNYRRVLRYYKTFDKIEYLTNLNIKCVLFEDNKEVLESAKKNKNILPINRESFISWQKIICE